MEIHRNGATPSKTAPSEYFTGTVRQDQPFRCPAPARGGALTVTFEAGARTAWHTHPLGQTIIVTAGVGWACVEGEPKVEIRPGDLVYFPPNTRHWHGATDQNAMTHIAIAESVDGQHVHWEEHVRDEDYLA